MWIVVYFDRLHPLGVPRQRVPPSHSAEQRPMLNPLRSEGEAFRLLLYVVGTLIVISVLILALRALL